MKYSSDLALLLGGAAHPSSRARGGAASVDVNLDSSIPSTALLFGRNAREVLESSSSSRLIDFAPYYRPPPTSLAITTSALYQRRRDSSTPTCRRVASSPKPAYRRSAPELSELSSVRQEQLQVLPTTSSAAFDWRQQVDSSASRHPWVPPPPRGMTGPGTVGYYDCNSFDSYVQRYREFGYSRDYLQSIASGRRSWEDSFAQYPCTSSLERMYAGSYSGRHNPADREAAEQLYQLTSARYFQTEFARHGFSPEQRRGQKRWQREEEWDNGFHRLGEREGDSSAAREALPSRVPHKHKVPRKGKICSNCHTSETPFWRKGKDDGLPLCNACGLYHTKNNMPRPVVLWKART